MCDQYWPKISIHILGFVKDVNMSKRCAIYSRVSTHEQTTSNQIMELKEIAARRGLTIVAEFSDEGISGVKGRDTRTGFDNLIKGAIKKDFDTILVSSVDRLGRSLQDLVPSSTKSIP